jgi:tetratricopeptide (TPR) repeat protein
VLIEVLLYQRREISGLCARGRRARFHAVTGNASGFFAILGSVALVSASSMSGACGQHTEQNIARSNKRLEIAKDFLSKNELEGAEGESNRAIALNPANDEAYVVRGSVAFVRALETKKTMEIEGCLTGVDAEATAKDLDTFLEKADQDFEHATKVTPDYGDAWAYRGVVHTLQEDYATATSFLVKALENPMRLRDPALTRAHLGWSLFHQQKHVEAAKELRTAIQFQPKMCVATYRLARVYFAREEWEKAAELFETASADPKCGAQEAVYYLMKTRMQQGLMAEAKGAQHQCAKYSSKSCIATKCRAEGPQ